MKVINRKKDGVEYSTIKLGETFEYEGNVYLKINSRDGNRDYKSINLVTADIAVFGVYVHVIPCDCEIHIL